MAALVNPVEARKGTLLGSWFAKGEDLPPEMKEFIARTERELERVKKRTGVFGEVVYTRFENWGKGVGDTWQVFLLR